MATDSERLVDSVLSDPAARSRLVAELSHELKSGADESWLRRARPFLAGASSAAVVLLAFLLPSLQDQWHLYKSGEAVDRYAEIGRGLMRDGHFESAEQSFERALELAGNDRLDLLEAQIKARVMRVYENSDWRGEVSDDVRESDFIYLLQIETAKARPQDRAATLTAYGAFLAGQERWSEAERCLKESIQLDPAASDPHIHLGNLYSDIDRGTEAEAEYRRAIALDPKEPNAHYDLGLLLTDSQKPAEAEAEFRAYVALRPLEVSGQLELARALAAQDKSAEALRAAEVAAKLDPQNEEVQTLLRSLRSLRAQSAVS